MVMTKSCTRRYPYSIVGIDLCSLLWNMLERRALHPHLYQLSMPISLQNFMDIFCKLLYCMSISNGTLGVRFCGITILEHSYFQCYENYHDHNYYRLLHLILQYVVYNLTDAIVSCVNSS